MVRPTRQAGDDEDAEDYRAVRRRLIAERHLEAMLELLQAKYGIKPEELPELLDSYRWVSKYRSNLGRVSWSASLGIIALAVSGLWSALLEGIKHLLK